MIKYFISILLMALLIGFRPSQAVDRDEQGTVELIITPVVSGKPLYADSSCLSPAGEQYYLKVLRFFISNIAFAASTGKESAAQTEAASGVFLADLLSSSSAAITFKMNEGEYSDLRFNVGVPRELNHCDPATAKPPLDLGRADMFWNWNSGYIFLLAEGGGKDVHKNSFHFAIGSDQRIMPLSFGNLFNVVPMVKVRKGKTTRIHLSFDFNKLLKNGDGSNYSLGSASSATVHGGYQADVLSLNAINCFEFLSSEIVGQK